MPEENAYMYPIKGIQFLFWGENRPILWKRVSAFALKVSVAFTTIFGALAGLTLQAQQNFLMEVLPSFLDHSGAGLLLVLGETLVSMMYFFYEHHRSIRQQIFDDVLVIQRVRIRSASPQEHEWIARKQQRRRSLEARSRRPSLVRVLPSILVDPETLSDFPNFKYYLTLPLNFFPVVGQALFCWLNAMEVAKSLHHYYYLTLKGLSPEEEAVMIHYRKKQYIQFGLVASALTLLPGLNLILVFTNAIAAALWAADIEKSYNHIV